MAKGGRGNLTGNRHGNTIDGTDAADVIDGREGDDFLYGYAGDDTLIGGEGDDLLDGGAGDDLIDGGAGTDTAAFSGARDDYTVTALEDGTILVAGPDGTDRFTDVEFFAFADLTQSAAEVVLPRLPNLAATGIAVSDAVLSPEEVVTVDFAIASDGVVDAGGSTARLVIATAPDGSAVFDTLDSTSLDALATGSGATVTFVIDASALAPGTYWVAVEADAGGVLEEENEADNLSDWIEITVEAPVMDVRVLNASVAETSDLDLAGGARIEMEYTIENASNFGTGLFEVVTYAVQVVDGHRFTEEIARTDVTLEHGETVSFSAAHDLPQHYPAGEVDIVTEVRGAALDRDYSSYESATTTVELIAPVYDIAVTSVDVLPTSELDLWQAADLRIAVTVANEGTAVPDFSRVLFYLSSDETVSADDILFWGEDLQLAPGESITFDLQHYADPALAPGTYHVLAQTETYAGYGPDPVLKTGGATVELTGGTSVFTEGDDVTSGTAGGDVLQLLGGDDLAHAGIGFDEIHGGEGFDTVDFSAWTAGVAINPDEWGPMEAYALPQDRYSGSSGENVTLLASVERVVGTASDDVVVMEGTSIREVALGDGADIVEGSAGSDVIDLGAGEDRVWAGAGDDLIRAGAGQDFVEGGLGDDTIFTGDGFDFVIVDRRTDGVTSWGDGRDVVEDFDPTQDTLVVEYLPGYGDYDPLADLVQTAEGALLSYAEGSSVLLRGVDVADLNGSNLFGYEEYVAYY